MGARPSQSELRSEFDSHRLKAKANFQCRRFKQAQSEIAQARKCLAKLEDPDGALVDLLLTYAQCALENNDLDDAWRSTDEARQLLAGMKHGDPLGAARTEGLLSLIELGRGRPIVARERYRTGVRDFLKLQSPIQNPDRQLETACCLALGVALMGEPDSLVAKLLEIQSPKRTLASVNPLIALDYYFTLSTASYRQGRYSEALEQLAPAMKPALTTMHYTFQAAHVNQIAGRVLDELGKTADAISAYGEALEIVKVIRECADEPSDFDRWYSSLLARFANCHAQTGSYQLASRYFTMATELAIQSLGPAHPEAIDLIFSCGECARVLGDNDYALRCFQMCLREENRNAQTKRSGLVMSNLKLGETLAAMGDHSEAIRHVERAFEILRQKREGQSESWARALISRAIVSLASGNQSDASKHCYEAAHILEGLGVLSNFIAALNEILAECALKQGDTAQAVQLAKQGISIVEEHRGGNLQYLLSLYETMFSALAYQHNWNEIRERIEPGCEAISGYLMDVFGVHTFDRLEGILARVHRIHAILLRAVFETGSADEYETNDILYDLLLKSRGLETRCGKLIRPGAGAYKLKGESRLFRKFDDYRDACIELMRELYILHATGQKHSKTAKELRYEIVERQRQWIAQSVSISDTDSEIATTTSHAARASLSDIQGVLEFVRTPDLDLDVTDASLAGRYYAFFVRKDLPITCFDLGWAAPIDRAVDSLKHLILQSTGTYERQNRWQRKAKFLSKRLIDPLPKAIFHLAPHLIIVPDGKLWELAFDVLPAWDQMVLDCSAISHALSGHYRAGEHLIRRPPNHSVVMGGIDYGKRPAQPALSSVVESPTLTQLVLAGSAGFTKLADTRDEAVAIAEVLDCEAVLNSDATKDQFFKMGSPEILHIATHGFFQDRPDTDAFSSLNSLHPMAKAGLALAKVNNALEGGSSANDNGILWGFEIEQLDLRQTDLVFLSACQSAVGTLIYGDGTQSLRRAFQIAGAHSVVASLWDVPSEATCQLAQGFYKRLKEGKSKVHAFWEAKKEARARNPDCPVYWAGFVLDGDSEPLWRYLESADVQIVKENFYAGQDVTVTVTKEKSES